MSKQERIKNYLKMGYSLTQKRAIELFSHYRLAVVINRLRNQGLNVVTVMIEDKNTKVSHAKYFVK